MFHRLIPKLQHPPVGGGDWAAVCRRQRSTLCSQHIQHLHTCKPHSECQDAERYVIADVKTETAKPISQVFLPFEGGETNNILKQIEQIPLCSTSFMAIGLNAPGIYSRVTEVSQNLVTQPENEVCCPLFLLLFITHIHTHIFSFLHLLLPFISIDIYLFVPLYLLSLLCHPYYPPIVCRLIGMLLLNRRSSA